MSGLNQPLSHYLGYMIDLIAHHGPGTRANLWSFLFFIIMTAMGIIIISY